MTPDEVMARLDPDEVRDMLAGAVERLAEPAEPDSRERLEARVAELQRRSDVSLTEFLLARIDEDEAQFHAAAEAHADQCRHDGMPDTTREEVEAYWLRREEGRAVTGWPRHLAECEAKWRIVELHGPAEWNDSPHIDLDALVCPECRGGSFPCDTLRILAAIYADHADFLDEWRP